MLNKKNDKLAGKCPFRNLKSCEKECVMYREGVRFTEDKGQAFPFADCALNIIADNLEAMHNRSYMMQKEVGEVKNVIAMKVLSDLGIGSVENAQRVALKVINLPKEDKKLLTEE
jgi:hypothetical protein